MKRLSHRATDAETATKPPEAPRNDEPKRVAGRYALLDRIGAGGAGVVYRAHDEVSGRVVAFKQLLSAKLGLRAKTMAALFEREYHTLVRLKHPRIVQVFEYGVTPEGPHYTMELLEGSDLRRLGCLPFEDVCRHLRDVASSLALLHAQRLVHRDVSPGNIRLTADGTARLLDFGALASFGTNTDIIGTPPFMAPEVLRQWPLDARTDVYSLGAVGYYCLTGRSAFPARSVNELPQLWQTPPVPPSALVSGVPPELERLILSMLSQDPLGRPETAAAVIDQLTAIGRLPPEPHERAEQSYFLSSPMVGRDTQTSWVLGRVEQAIEGKGGLVLLEGTAGIGKTRLADELCIASTLKGAVALRVDAESARASFGVAVALGQRLLEACPEIARRAAEPHLLPLRTLAPELADALGGPDSGTLMTDPTERRMRFHSALREWFLGVSRERTLVVSVDNLHAADDDSASFLAMLGRDGRSARVLVLTTVRSGTQIAAPDAVKILRDRAQRLKLPALDAKACELLANGLFGGATNAGRVGSLLSERSGGVPRQFIELAQLMLQKKIAKYEAGGWVLPLEVAHDELPARAEEILSARLSELGADAVALAERLAVHSCGVTLAVALAVSELPGEGRTYAVLDELLAEQILVSEGDRYRFRQEAIREAVLSRMDPEGLRQSRVRAAEALLAAEAPGVAERVEAALHLVDAGEEQRGTRILVGAAREFAAGAGTHQNANQLVLALCRVVRAYDAQGRSDYELAALLFPLLPLAYYSANWKFILEYGERAINIGLRITGLSRAAELEPRHGREAALKMALGASAAAFAEHAGETLGYDLKTAIAATAGVLPACMGVYATCFDSESVARVAQAVAPISYFGEEHVAYGMYLFAAAEAPMIGGRETDARPVWEAALARFENPAFAAAVGEMRARVLQGGAHFMLGLLDCYYFGDRALATANRMDGFGVKAWSITADQLRILYHALRGETNEVKTYMDRVELNAVQGGHTWQTEMFWPALLLNADVLTSDAMSARRRYVQLDRRCQEVKTLKPHAEAAHAAYLMLRGDVSEAVAAYERLLPSFPIRKCVAWETTRAYFARALNAAGAHARAKAVAEEVISNMSPADYEHVCHFLEAERQLALAESGLGDHQRAAALLDALLAKHGGESNSLLVGLLHQARAEVAQRAADTVTADAHRTEMERHFRKTRNPALIAQCEAAQRLTVAHSVVRPRHDRHQPAPNTVSAFPGATVSALPALITDAEQLAKILEDAEEPLHVALDLVLRQTKANGAFLYLPVDGGLELAWSSSNGKPPKNCVDELGRWVSVVRENDGEENTQSGNSALVIDAATVSGYRLVALRSARERTFVGGLILEAGPMLDLAGCTHLLDAIGRAVEEQGEEAAALITA